MTSARAKRLVCFTCSLPITADDGEHYGYLCHECVVHEHELTVILRTDPDHPDLWVLTEGPVELGIAQAKAAFTSSVLSRPIES